LIRVIRVIREHFFTVSEPGPRPFATPALIAWNILLPCLRTVHKTASQGLGKNFSPLYRLVQPRMALYRALLEANQFAPDGLAPPLFHTAPFGEAARNEVGFTLDQQPHKLASFGKMATREPRQEWPLDCPHTLHKFSKNGPLPRPAIASFIPVETAAMYKT
jgi:hypothetical protein